MKTPIKLQQFETAFDGRAMEILPAMKDIPEEFHDANNKWHNLASTWFFRGLKARPAVKPGIDANDALANIQTALRSFEPKHEHKMAGVAYLMSMWLEDASSEHLQALGA